MATVVYVEETDGVPKRLRAVLRHTPMASSHDTPFEHPEIGCALPEAANAVVPRAKLEDYALDPEHGDGASKARLFRSILGIERDDWEYLHDAILSDLPSRPVHARRGKAESRWVTWSVQVWVEGLNGRGSWVLTAWKYERGVPHLVTVYISLSGSQSS